MIETWGFFVFAPPRAVQAPEELTAAQYQSSFRNFLELWVNCERWGFDGLAWAEHHFFPISLAPSPHLLVAAVAAKTERIRLTTLGSVLSMHDGRRFAEECGMLAYLTNGRFEPGIAPGSGAAEAVLAGIPAEQARPRYYSAAEVLAKALAGSRVTHHDQFHNLDNLFIMPRPQLAPGQSVWVTVMSPDSAGWCARRGYKMCTAWMPTQAAAGLAALYREAAEVAGTPATPSMLALRRRVFVADSDAEAKEKHEAATDLMVHYAGKAFETADPKVFRMMTEPDDYAIGSPETVAERLIEQCRAGGYGVMMAFTDFAFFEDFKTLARSHELIGTRVAPILRNANLAVGGQPSSAADAGQRQYLRELETRRKVDLQGKVLADLKGATSKG